MTTIELKSKLEAMILGQEKSAGQCCCGAIQWPKAVVTSIEVANDPKDWYLWSVRLEGKKADGSLYKYSTGLTMFIEVEEVEQLFSELEQ